MLVTIQAVNVVVITTDNAAQQENQEVAPGVIQPIRHQPIHQPVELVNTFGIHTLDILWMGRLQVRSIQDRDQLNKSIYSQREEVRKDLYDQSFRSSKCMY